MFKRFPKTNSRIKRNRHGVNTALYGARMLLSKKISHFRDNVSISRFHLHRPRISLHVHDNETRFAFGNQRHHFFVASSSGNVVYNRSSCLDCRDRKSTRLNSSHVEISYAVFCLKKKKKNRTATSKKKKKRKQSNRK